MGKSKDRQSQDPVATQSYPHISKPVESNQRCNILFIYTGISYCMVYKKMKTVSWTQAITPQRTVDLDFPPQKWNTKMDTLLQAGTGFCNVLN